MSDLCRFWRGFAIGGALALIYATPSLAAGALPEVFLAKNGVDAPGCGALTAPCRLLSYALANAVAPAGTIYLTTDGNFGVANIVNSVSIVAKGAAGAAPAGVNAFGSASTAITINAGATGRVTLDGLTIDGGNNAPRGVSIQSAQSVVLKNCMIRNLQPSGGIGLLATPTTPLSLTIEDTKFLSFSTGPGGIPESVHVESTGANIVTAALNRVQAIGPWIVAKGPSKVVLNDSSFPALKVEAGAAAELTNSRGVVQNAGVVAFSRSAVTPVDLGGQFYSFLDNVAGSTTVQLNPVTYK